MSEPLKQCQIADCRRPHFARGFCKRHYAQILRHGKLAPELERGGTRLCAAPGCDKSVRVGSYCRKHKRQVKLYKRLTPGRERRKVAAACSFPGCKNPHRAKGLCSKHYHRERRLKMKAEKARASGA